MGGTEKRPHALVVPAPGGQGHVSGCTLLARSLAALGFKVTFVYFSTHYAQLKGSNRLVLPYSNSTSCTSAHGVDHPPSNSQTSNEAAAGLIELRVVEDGFAPGDADKPFFFVTPTMKENLFNLILELREQDTPPTCLVSHAFAPWTLHVAQRAHIPRIDVWTSNALANLTMINLPPLFSQGTFPETGSSRQWKCEPPLMLDHIPGLPPFSSELYPPEVRFADPSHPWVLFATELSACSKHAERILINTMPELEADAFHAYQVHGIPAYGIGPLLHYMEKSPSKGKPVSSQAEGKAGIDSISWLDTQAESSVIYVAFGSVASLSAEETQELAFGLEASGSPFFWAIRGGADLTQVLPEGFLERTRERGRIFVGWAPQVELLAHRAIGGFLTHCGWNSSVESLWHGVPLLCCPRFAEQRLNMNYLCNVWGAGLELERTETGGLERAFVEVGVKALMQEEVGRNARRKAHDMMQLARTTCQPGGRSFNNLQKFYDDMKLLCSQSK